MASPDGDEKLKALFDRHYNEVRAYCIRRIGVDEADDVAAEVFAAAWRHIDDLDRDRAKAWLYGAARKTLANRFRSLRRRRRRIEKLSGLVSFGEDTPEVLIVQRDEDGEAIRALRTLNRIDREVLTLAAWEGLNTREIATALDISVAAAEQRLHRAKKRYAKALEPHSDQLQLSPRAANKTGGV